MLMGADHLIALAVVAAPGAPERRKRRDVESRGGDYRAEDEDEDENDDDRTTRFGARPGLRRALRSAMLGVQWGCGHALGLALVCAVFFATRRRMNLDDFGEYADKAVGASMIALGLVSLWSLWRWRRRRDLERAHIADAGALGAGDPEVHGGASDGAHRLVGTTHRDEIIQGVDGELTVTGSLVLEAGSEEHAAAHDMHLPHVHVPRGSPVKQAAARTSPEVSRSLQKSEDEDESEASKEVNDSSEREEDKSRGRWSLSIGLVHGIAGPSGILAVLPAVVLADAGKSTAYLVAFFVASTAAMGAFAGLFGYVTDLAVRRQMDGKDATDSLGGHGFDSHEVRVTRASDAATRVAMGLNLGAGVLAVCVGTLWLTLSGLGLLGSL